MTVLDLIKLKIHSKITRNSLYKEYSKLCQTPSLKKKYIYFPLHFQPERTSCPEGDIYSDQWLVVNMISSILPQDWFLYVKEHPSQFMLTNGYMGRNKYFYNDIQSFHNVKLIDESFNTFELIDNAEAVVTLTGTVGLEYIIRGVPAIVCGYAWYRECPGVFYVTTAKECKDVLIKIDNGYTVDVKSVKSYLLGLHKYFTKAYLNPSTKSSVQMTEAELIHNLYSAIVSAGILF